MTAPIRFTLDGDPAKADEDEKRPVVEQIEALLDAGPRVAVHADLAAGLRQRFVEFALVIPGLAGEQRNRVDQTADLAAAPAERLVQFGHDGGQLVDAAARHQRAEGRQGRFDLRSEFGAVRGDDVAVAQHPRGRAVGFVGCGEPDERIAQCRWQFHARGGVGRQPGAVLQPQLNRCSGGGQ